MARLKDDYEQFKTRGAEVLAVGPDPAEAFKLYWRAQGFPFIGLSDPGHKVAQRYNQEVNLFKLGRLPIVIVIDRQGRIRYRHFASSMSDIPANGILLGAIDQLIAPSE